MQTPPPAASFARLLRRFRLSAQLTQSALAERATLSREAISVLERGGRQYPRSDTVVLLAEALGLVGDDRAALIAAAARPARPRADHQETAVAAPDASEVLRFVADEGSSNGRLDGPAFRLPTPLTPLLGRSAEVEEACDLLVRRQVRLLTLTGPGGVGKTRLALEVAAVSQDQFQDGAAFVQLASLLSPELLEDTLLRALGMPSGMSGAPLSLLVHQLTDRHLLLVLDNFEHLLAASPVLAELLTNCPRLSLLVTSRGIVNLRGARAMRVPPLAVPDAADAAQPSPAELPCVALFVARAQAVRPTFQLTADSVADVISICQRLDGLPLAIELAAVHIRLLSPRALLARLERRLPTLRGGPRDLPERHQTLRAALTWSYDLLSQQQQLLLKRLSVFAGGTGLTAAETVCADSPHEATELLDSMMALADHSLIRQVESADPGEPRVDMLETIREFAREQLENSGELTMLQRRHAEHFASIAEQAESALRSAAQHVWLQQLEREHDNFRAALRWSSDSNAVGTGLRIAGGLWYFWWLRGYVSEGRMWLGRLLDLLTPATQLDAPLLARSKAIYGAAWLAYAQTDYEAANQLAIQADALSDDTSDGKRVRGFALNTLSMVAMDRGDYDRATRIQERALALRRELNDRTGIGVGLNNLGLLAMLQKDYPRALALLHECASQFRADADLRNAALALVNLGRAEFEAGGITRAATTWVECLQLAAQLGFRLREESTLQSLEGMAQVAAAREHMRQAARLLGAAAQFRKVAGVPRPGRLQAAYDEAVRQATEALGIESFAAAQLEGATLTMESAVTEALAGAEPVTG